MAKPEIFHSTISEEPSTGAVRGKLPGRMVSAMNADPGDVIAFEVVKGKIVAGRVLSSREARDYKAENGRGGGSAKSTAKAKAGKKAKKSTGSGKASKKAKSNKRKTSVEYDEAPQGKKKGKK
jgi:hypothetical protein